MPNAIYLIAGAGDDKQRLEHLAAERGLAGRVVFTGHVPADELPSYYALADVFAMPSTGEGFGIVFLEAAACGLPVIAGNADGSVDALGEGQIGCLVDPRHTSKSRPRRSVLCKAASAELLPGLNDFIWKLPATRR